MSEFFKAAAQTDTTVLKVAPMYIDAKVVMEEQHRKDSLVAQTLMTKQFLRLLDDIDEEEKLEDARDLALEDAQERERLEVGSGRDDSYVEDSLLAEGTAKYKKPPAIDQASDPSRRNLGSAAQLKKVENQNSLFRKKLQDRHDEVKRIEANENLGQEAKREERKQMSERELNALVVSKQIAAREAEAQRLRDVAEAERGKRRAHPIDVLHQQIAHELIEESSGEVHDVAGALDREALGLDHYLDTLERKKKQHTYKHLSPSKHIPNGFIV